MSSYRHRLRTQALAAALLLAVSAAAPARTRPAAKAATPSARTVPHAAHPLAHAPKPAAARTLARPHAVATVTRVRAEHSRPAHPAARPGRAVAALAHRSHASDGTGHATVYSRRLSGRPTASGERFDPEAMTAAHRTLPLGTAVRVTRLDTGHSIVVTINDRGVGRRGRIIDLSPAAARRLGFRTGAARVSVEPLGRG